MSNTGDIQSIVGGLLVSAVLAAGFFVSEARSADTKQLAVTAVVLSRSNCQFTGNGAASLDFGALNPVSAPNVLASVTFNARCVGNANPATFVISQDSGLYSTGLGQNRMRHDSVPTEFVPYTLAISPTNGTVARNRAFPVTVTGTVLGTTYQSALVGNYSDAVRITINP